MALRPGRQRSSATPIIAKGLVYPLQNQRASKSDTQHKKSDAKASDFSFVPQAQHRLRGTRNII